MYVKKQRNWAGPRRFSTESAGPDRAGPIDTFGLWEWEGYGFHATMN